MCFKGAKSPFCKSPHVWKAGYSTRFMRYLHNRLKEILDVDVDGLIVVWKAQNREAHVREFVSHKPYCIWVVSVS